jgi:uncharacterized protein (UPF0262 family)
MLDRTSTYTSPRPLSSDGTQVDRLSYRRMTKSQRAALAVNVIRGILTLRPTMRVVAAAMKVCPDYVARAKALSPPELQALRLGQRTLSNQRRKHVGTTIDLCIDRVCNSKGMTREDAQLYLFGLLCDTFAVMPSEDDVAAFVNEMSRGERDN